MEKSSLILAVVVFVISICDGYKIGLGRADCTGPSVEIAFVSLRNLISLFKQISN